MARHKGGAVNADVPARILSAGGDEAVHLLREEDYECDCALTPNEAADALRNNSYSLLIADVKGQDDGVMRLVQDLPRDLRALPIVIITDSQSFDFAVQAVRLPALAFITKPVNEIELLAAVKQGIDHYRIAGAVLAAGQRMEACRQELRDLEILMRTRPVDEPVDAVLSSFLGVTLNHLIGGLANLNFLARLMLDRERRDERSLLKMPCALLEAVEVIEKTKIAFKSKELAALRKKLQKVVNESTDQPVFSLRNQRDLPKAEQA